MKHVKIGDMLVREGGITKAQLEEALALQQTIYKDRRIGDILVALNYLTEEQLMQCLSKGFRIPFVDLKRQAINHRTIHLLDERLARHYTAVCIDEKENTLTVAMDEPLNLYAIEEMRLATNREITAVIASKGEIERLIESGYDGHETLVMARSFRMAFDEAEKDEAEEVQVSNVRDKGSISHEHIDNAPVVKMVDAILQQAIKLQASDIHIEPGSRCTRVRMRIDGVLQQKMTLHSWVHEQVVTRLKLMGHMNIAEKRIPQDGSFQLIQNHKKRDIRVAIVPTPYGEKMVMRMLSIQDQHLLTLEELGLTPYNLTRLQHLIRSPHGAVLVTGPTGSGKSTTLYAILQSLNKVTDNIMTLEDPIEKKIEGINQVQINPKIGLTFASGLRALLRQDPDVMMIGEMRDSETASIAMRAAVTGHLVLSTLHTNDAASTLVRLVDMGIDGYMVSAALVGVIAQRLTRCICPLCKQPYESTPEEREVLHLKEVTTLYKGTGCQSCSFTGYKGRRGVYEIMIVDSGLKQLLSKGAQGEELRDYAKAQGMQLLKETMKELILKGHTTVEEYVKMTYSVE